MDVSLWLGQQGLGEAERDIFIFLFSIKPDRTFEIKIGQPTVSYFLKAAAGIEKGARQTGKDQDRQLGFWEAGRKEGSSDS